MIPVDELEPRANADGADTTTDRLRDDWRRVMSMKRTTQQFRTKLERSVAAIDDAAQVDPQFGDVVMVTRVLLRILDWAVGDLDRLRLPDELFEEIPPHTATRTAGQISR